MDLFDLHCDTITVCSSKNLELRRNDLHISLERLPAGSRWGQAFAIFVPDELRGEKAVEFFRENVRFFRAEMEKNADRIVQASDYQEIMQAFDNGKFAAILTVEGGAALGGQLEMLDELRNCGVRMLTLTWNGENELGSGSDTHKGLTPFGIEAVRRMEELGIWWMYPTSMTRVLPISARWRPSPLSLPIPTAGPSATTPGTSPMNSSVPSGTGAVWWGSTITATLLKRTAFRRI
ncbi:MAG: membrane dipeptidase [Acutalibacteraceae bacterium]